MGIEPLVTGWQATPAHAGLVGAPRVEPHKHDTNYPPQEDRGCGEAGARWKAEASLYKHLRQELMVQVGCSESKFNDCRRRLIEVAEAEPARPDANVGQTGPPLPVAPIGKPDEITFLQAFKVSSSGLVRYAFWYCTVRSSPFTMPPMTNAQWAFRRRFDHFTGRVNRVEDDLKVVRHDEADDCSLRDTKRQTDA